MNILARIRSYDDLAAALKTERRRQGLSQTKVEQSLGWDWEYLWKLESLRKYPAGRLADWLRGLGVELALVRREATGSTLSDCPANPDVYNSLRKKIAAKGGRARARNIKAEKLRAIGRKGGKERWRRYRASMPKVRSNA